MTTTHPPLIAALRLDVTSLEPIAGLDVRALTRMGVSRVDATMAVRLAEVYYGKTHATRLQAAARTNAQSQGHSLRILEKIEGKLAKVRNSWQIRARLCATPEHLIDATARKLIKKPPRKPRASFSHGANGWMRLAITTDKPWLKDALQRITGLSDSVIPSESAILRGFEKLGRGEASLSDVAPAPARVANVIITLDELTQIAQGAGEEIQLRATDGTVRNGADFVTERLTQHGLATLVHPRHGPVNQYRMQRFANAKQRDMALSAFPQCAHPGCTIPGTDCQVDHITPWKSGGETNAGNLLPLCRYHNGLKAEHATYRRTKQGVMFIPPFADPIACRVD